MTRGSACWMLPAAFAASLGAQPTAPPAPPPQFEVASVKPSPPIANGGFFRVGPSRSGTTVEFGRQSLKQLIASAYGVKTLQVSGPEWTNKARFDIEAKVPEGTSGEEVPPMLQALLAERFGLKLHHDSKELPGWAVVVTKGGAKLTAADPPPPPGMGDAAPTSGAKPESPKAKGYFNTRTSLHGGVLTGLGVTMRQLAEILSRYAGRQVTDATGLPGTYNIAIDVSPEEVLNGRLPMVRAMMDSMPRPAPPAPAGEAGGMTPQLARRSGGGDITGISLFQSIRRYGLKLESHKEMFDILVIDHAEKSPADN